jgi:hypothetical protein
MISSAETFDRQVGEIQQTAHGIAETAIIGAFYADPGASFVVIGPRPPEGARSPMPRPQPYWWPKDALLKKTPTETLRDLARVLGLEETATSDEEPRVLDSFVYTAEQAAEATKSVGVDPPSESQAYTGLQVVAGLQVAGPDIATLRKHPTQETTATWLPLQQIDKAVSRIADPAAREIHLRILNIVRQDLLPGAS